MKKKTIFENKYIFQFTLPQQSDEMDSYFGIFYFCINVGAAFSIIATPFLRCLSKCYKYIQ